MNTEKNSSAIELGKKSWKARLKKYGKKHMEKVWKASVEKRKLDKERSIVP